MDFDHARQAQVAQAARDVRGQWAGGGDTDDIGVAEAHAGGGQTLPQPRKADHEIALSEPAAVGQQKNRPVFMDYRQVMERGQQHAA